MVPFLLPVIWVFFLGDHSTIKVGFLSTVALGIRKKCHLEVGSYFFLDGWQILLKQSQLLWCLSTREYSGHQFTFLGHSVLQAEEQNIPSCQKPWQVFRWGAQPTAEISHAISLVYLTDSCYFLQTQDILRVAQPSLWWMGRCRKLSNIQIPHVSFYSLGL